MSESKTTKYRSPKWFLLGAGLMGVLFNLIDRVMKQPQTTRGH